METIFVPMYLNSTVEVQLVAIEQVTEPINNSLIVRSTEKIEHDASWTRKEFPRCYKVSKVISGFAANHSSYLAEMRDGNTGSEKRRTEFEERRNDHCRYECIG